MNHMEKFLAIIETLRDTRAPMEALAKGAHKDPIKSYVFSTMLRAFDKAIEEMDDLRYSLPNPVVYDQKIDDLQHQLEYARQDVKRYQALAVQHLPSIDVFPNVLMEVKNGNKINAIKEYRTATGCGLKEAKDKVESYAG